MILHQIFGHRFAVPAFIVISVAMALTDWRGRALLVLFGCYYLLEWNCKLYDSKSRLASFLTMMEVGAIAALLLAPIEKIDSFPLFVLIGKFIGR